jgi:hypothetical protein
MKKIMKKFAVMAVGLALTLALATHSHASSPQQVPGIGGDESSSPPSSGGSNSSGSEDPVVATIKSLAALTNHTKLVEEVFGDVRGVGIKFEAKASVDGYEQFLFFAYTNKVKMLSDIMDLVEDHYAYLSVVDTKAPISISVHFYDTDSEQVARGYTSQDARLLFEGYNGGTPIQDRWGDWIMPVYAQKVQMSLAGNILVAVTNTVNAFLVYTNAAGQYQSQRLEVEHRVGFVFPPDWAGQGILVLGSYRYVGSSIYYDEHAYDLGNGGQEVPITTVLVQALIEESEDMKSFVNSTNISVRVYSYQDSQGNYFGKVPFIMADCRRDLMTVHLSVTDDYGRAATVFEIENKQTGVKMKVPVPSGSSQVAVSLPKGKYHIVSYGLDLKPWWMYSYYYPGKG